MQWVRQKNVSCLYFHADVPGSTAAQLRVISRAISRKHAQNTLNLAGHHHRSSNHHPHKSLPSDSSRSNSASWSLTSLGRADRSTPRSAIVGSAAACGMFAISPRTAASTQHEAFRAKSTRGMSGGGVYSIFVTPRHRHDWGTGGKLAGGACQSRDRGWR